ncbi:MAG TPA: hypothetical protein VFU15_13700 [Bacteroidia bacterium]|nr:hypothetical protein [Bacteroidia bacterium]
MKRIFLLAMLSAAFGSCCIYRPSIAQSDRIDTHRPPFPIVDCVPCHDLRNRSENFSWMEVMGPSGSFAAGMEAGRNFSYLRLYGAAGISGWAWRGPNASFLANAGIAIGNPNFFVRPDIGAGFSEWWLKDPRGKTVQLHPALKTSVEKGGYYPAWNVYGGLRFAFPFSSVNLSLRLYRVSTFGNTSASAWYPGIACGFRF